MEQRMPMVRKTVSAAAVLAVYYVFVRLTGLSIPCMFYEITGLKCPSCGITHMLLHAVRFEFADALKCNALLFFMLPFLGTLLLIKLIFMPDWLKKDSRIFKAIVMSCCVLLVAFGVLRNIPLI